MGVLVFLWPLRSGRIAPVPLLFPQDVGTLISVQFTELGMAKIGAGEGLYWLELEKL